jgi:phenylacetate-CoA ligase
MYNWLPKKDIITRYFVGNEEPLELWNKDKMNQYTYDGLKSTIVHAMKNNNYYREKLAKAGISCEADFSMEKFEKIDLLNKSELVENKELILSVPKEEVSQVFLSTGTTSKDFIFVLHTWEDLYINDLSPEMPLLFPVEPRDTVAVALPYEMSSSGLSFHRVLQDGAGAAVVSVGKGGAYSEPEKTLKVLKELAVTVIMTSPSYAMYLYKKSIEMGLDINKELKIETIWLTGEGCSNSFRDRIEKLWNCNAYFYYGSLECGPIGIECREKNGYHITSGHIYVEIIDPDTGEILAPGEIGEIVVTTLLKDGCPFIRYRTQDTGYMEETECNCGIKLKRLFLRGRKADLIHIAGKEYSPFYIEEQLMRIEDVGNNYQFLVYDDLLVINVETENRTRDTVELEEEISSRVEFGCGVPNKVHIVDSLTYDGKKAKRVVKKSGCCEEV